MKEIVKVNLIDKDTLNPFRKSVSIGVFTVKIGKSELGDSRYILTIKTNPEYTKDRTVNIYPTFKNKIEVECESLAMGLYHLKAETTFCLEAFDYDHLLINQIFIDIYKSLHPLFSADIPNFDASGNVLFKPKKSGVTSIIIVDPIKIYGSVSVMISRSLGSFQTHIQFKSNNYTDIIKVPKLPKDDILSYILDQYKTIVSSKVQEYIKLRPENSASLKLSDYYDKLDYYILPTNIKVPPTTPLFIMPRKSSLSFLPFCKGIKNWPKPIENSTEIDNVSDRDNSLSLFTSDKDNMINLTLVIAPKINVRF